MSMHYNSVVCMIDPTRSTGKSLTKPFNRQTANSSASALRQSSDETKQSASKIERLICCRCGGNGHPARPCSSPDDCQDVDEVGTEPSVMLTVTYLFGLDCGDDSIATINSVAERNDRTHGGKELLAFVVFGAVHQCVLSILWR